MCRFSGEAWLQFEPCPWVFSLGITRSQEQLIGRPLKPSQLLSAMGATARTRTASLKGIEIMSFLKAVLSFVIGLFLIQGLPAIAQDKPYKEGSVWAITFVKIKPGMFDQYLRDVGPQRKRMMDEAQKQGLVLSYKVLSGSAANRDDWDLMFMEEYKNWAAFDGLSDKFEAIESKQIGSDEKRTQMMVKRTEVREIVGDKLLQELILK
jgi:hypothetical protein